MTSSFWPDDQIYEETPDNGMSHLSTQECLGFFIDGRKGGGLAFPLRVKPETAHLTQPWVTQTNWGASPLTTQ